MNTNDTLRPRRIGGRSGSRNKAAMAGARIQISTRQARPTATPAVEAARISSSDRSRFWTSAEASPIRTKKLVNRTTRLAIGHEPEGGRHQQPRDGRGVGQVGDHERHRGQAEPAQAGRGLRREGRLLATRRGRVGTPVVWPLHLAAALTRYPLTFGATGA